MDQIGIKVGIRLCNNRDDFSYTGSPQLKISQKSLGGLLFRLTLYASRWNRGDCLRQ